jgi:hypothetical protein
VEFLYFVERIIVNDFCRRYLWKKSPDLNGV